MNFFKNMVSIGLLNMSNRIDALLLRYCFLNVIEMELKRMCNEWNLHRIRQNRKAETFGGKPFLMYNCPDMFNTCTYRKTFDENEMTMMDETLFDQYDFEEHPIDFVNFIAELVGDHSRPKNAMEALALYREVKRKILRLETLANRNTA